MGFQPFGYFFEIESLKSPEEAKQAIRARMKPWFDQKNGARGWIAGPVVCLWLSAFDRHGPMLFGWINRSEAGSRIRGRAGSDLNGVAAFAILLFLLTLLASQMLSDGDSLPVGFILVLVLSPPLVFWMAHKDRRHADPLVRFLRNTVAGLHRSTSSGTVIFSGFQMDIGGKRVSTPVSAKTINRALLDAEAGDVVILHSAPERYIQTASEYGRFIIEKRDGDHCNHFEAVRTDRTADRNAFSLEEADSIFLAYASGKAMPDFMEWRPLNMPPPSEQLP